MSSLADWICRTLGAQRAEPAAELQQLWSGYGNIVRYHLEYDSPSSGAPKTVIAKAIRPPDERDHPRGWNTDLSHRRKLRSYQVEANWYQSWAHQCPAMVAQLLGYTQQAGTTVLLLSDLDAAGFAGRHTRLHSNQTLGCLSWLAKFHARFAHRSAADHQSIDWPDGLWPVGTYWHLDTRPDEWSAMAPGPLKDAARAIDQRLSQSDYLTLVHGDAKVANFCFGKAMDQVAAVDFQYVGGGCGMKDVVYFLGSCLSEHDCQQHQSELLDYYFRHLHKGLISCNPKLDADELVAQWRELTVFAWADFQRFIEGWSPNHHKNNEFSQRMTRQALAAL
ncbi:oxidoreductase family protein [Pseudomaricurvus alkylphenolicus]|uniref:oxidoreductase family protein n=1 Tax=Pseudomaricurvus alkylphenolicus TaxID=1306991 RepID=UPI00197DA9AE|nr:oxidoreductase family protein [Pseudomaricurvus alkylphenolicus]